MESYLLHASLILTPLATSRNEYALTVISPILKFKLAISVYITKPPTVLAMVKALTALKFPTD